MGKYLWFLTATVLTDFSTLGTLQAVTYILKVVVSKKWREIDTLLLHTTNRKYFYLFFLFRNLVKQSEMPRPLALTGITAHTQKHFTSSDKTQKKKKIYIYI